MLARIFQGLMAYVNGRYEASLDIMRRLSADTGNEAYRLVAESMCYPEMGREADGTAALEKLEQEHGDDWTYVIGAIHARQGRTDEALKWLERAYEENGPSALTVAYDDFMLDSLREDPRWEALLAEAGVSPEQLAAIDFDVELPDK